MLLLFKMANDNYKSVKSDNEISRIIYYIESHWVGTLQDTRREQTNVYNIVLNERIENSQHSSTVITKYNNFKYQVMYVS